MKPVPILFFAFANEEGRFLDALKEESRAIYTTLHPLENAGRLLVVREESADSDELFVTFRRFKDRMLIFHFAGHAGSNLLALEDLQADASALANLFKEQKDTLKLVFLNGCATRGQVARLLQLGIRAVIATSRPVEDQSAKFFAETFYAALSEGQYSLKGAFDHARTTLAAKFQKAANEFRGIDTATRQGAEDFPWGLYSNRAEDLDWKIGDPFLPMSELRKASREHYAEMRSGAFRYLRIEDALLKDQEKKDRPDIIPIIVELNGENSHLETAVKKLWTTPLPHAILTGKGGMGKTVSLDYLWQYFLDSASPDKGVTSDPIPLYLALEEVNEWGDNRDDNFIREQLHKRYYIEDLKDFLGDNISQGPPNVLLLLDGLHYVSKDKIHSLIEEISLLCNPKNFPNLQILLTAQEDLRPDHSDHNWPLSFQLLQLQPLSPLDIRRYLGDAAPLGTELIGMLSNPMMLALYKVSNSKTEKQVKGTFRTDITKTGELLANVEWMALQSLQEKLERNPEEMAVQRFVLEHLLPFIGWTMHKADIAMISRKENPEINLRSLLPVAIPALMSENFFDSFDRFFDRYLDERRFDLPPRQLFNQIIREVCMEKLAMIVEEKDGVRFLHNLFRDYFAARHILNQIDLSLTNGEIPPILRNFQLKPAVSQMIGEIEGEHHYSPWVIAPGKANRIARLLELCRGNFREQALGFTLQNLFNIMILARGELSGANLKLLDLRKVELNKVRLSRWEEKKLQADFFGALVSRKTFFSEKALFRKKFTCYSPDGKRVLLASKNGEAFEWTIARPNLCIRAFTCGFDLNRVQYTADGNGLLLFSENEIVEWDLAKAVITHKYTAETLPPDKAAPDIAPPENAEAEAIARIRNVPGMYFQGCDFRGLHPDSNLDPPTIRQMQRMGGIFSDADAKAFENALPPPEARPGR